MRGFIVRFGEPADPAFLGGSPILGFLGPGEPGPRKVNWKAKAKARARRKATRTQKRHMRRP